MQGRCTDGYCPARSRLLCFARACIYISGWLTAVTRRTGRQATARSDERTMPFLEIATGDGHSGTLDIPQMGLVRGLRLPVLDRIVEWEHFDLNMLAWLQRS